MTSSPCPGASTFPSGTPSPSRRPRWTPASTAPTPGTKGLDLLVLLDAILGTPDNIGYWMDDLLA